MAEVSSFCNQTCPDERIGKVELTTESLCFDSDSPENFIVPGMHSMKQQNVPTFKLVLCGDGGTGKASRLNSADRVLERI
jgi:hypothetical protein